MNGPATMSFDMWAMLRNSADGETCELYAYMFWKCPNSKLPFASRFLDCMYTINTQLQSVLRGNEAPPLIVASDPPMPAPRIDEETGELYYYIEPTEFDRYRASLYEQYNDLVFYRDSSIYRTADRPNNGNSIMKLALSALNNLINEYVDDMGNELLNAVNDLTHSFFEYLISCVLEELNPTSRPLKRSEPDGGLAEFSKRRR